MVAPILLAVIVAVALVVAYPFEMLSLIVIAYFALIPASIQRYRRLAREDAERQASEKTASAPAEAGPA